MNLEELALKFDDARNAVVTALKTEPITEAAIDAVRDKISEQVTLSLQLREKLILHSTIKVTNPRAAAILKELQPNPSKETEEALWEFGDQWFGYRDLPGYVRRLMEARPLILPVEIPAQLHVFVHEARDCYRI